MVLKIMLRKTDQKSSLEITSRGVPKRFVLTSFFSSTVPWTEAGSGGLNGAPSVVTMTNTSSPPCNDDVARST